MLWDDGRAVLRARWHLRNAEHLGERVRVRGRPVVTGGGRLIVHDRVQIVSTIATTELVAGRSGTLEIGSGTFVNYGVSISARLEVRLGRRCLIGTYCLLMDNDFHTLDPDRRLDTPASAPIILEDNVWLGARAIVLRGTTIGEGSVVAAGSVVAGDVPPRSLVGGVPARIIREL